ncbi:related to tetratricopeptide repeat protein 1 (TTC1) [Cephalotrichum gorgonifer]|uniref:Related to tetratricopeptide repeat protein 1 (TTC1) n=1 Tax=Cephalotrichum gorgonifer TaxID=2041049 RepID=A0AAE8MXS1_9PEZI|nr:related to tetratricopeptide repeat protein 1 (TTC1) [Cephalotrichum gorgonifer]
MASQSTKESSPTRISPNNDGPEIADDAPVPITYSPEEEATLLNESNEKKSEANTLFVSKDYPAALAKYDEAIDVCPRHLDYELAVLRCNVSACHLKLDEWKDAISSATAALEGLIRVEARDAPKEKKGREGEGEDEDVEEEIISSGAADAAPMPVREDEVSKRKADVKRIRAKALMRRARARSELGGWQNLAGAEEDYKVLVAMDNLGRADRKIVRAQLKELPTRVKAAQEQETAEMWAKLKDLGNGILRPFGLSTDNFQMKKDEKTGGYSMNFNGSG